MEVIQYPNSPFKLHQPFPPAGDQPTAIAGLLEGLSDGLAYQTLLGVTGSGKTYTMANVIAQSGRPAIIMAHNKTLAAQLYAEMREFFPENAVEYFVSYYDYYQPEAYVPSRDLFIEKDSAINEHIEQMRLSATKNLMTRDDVIIVATVSAIYGIGDPTEYQQMVLSVKEGDTIEQRDIIATLVSMQYERGDLDFKRGSFRVRGDVIDVYPAESSENALRISLFDDEIDRLDMFDPLSGSLHQRVGRYTVFPSSHYVTPRNTVLRACESIKEELRERIEFFAREQRPVEQQRIEQRTRFDLEMLYENGLLQRHRKLLPPLLRQKRRRTAAHADGLPARQRHHVHRRKPRYRHSNRRYVQRRRIAQAKPRRLRLPPAFRPRQPTAQIPRI